jgi:hypothetical protein
LDSLLGFQPKLSAGNDYCSYRDAAVGTPSCDVARMARIDAAAARIGASDARREERPQRDYTQTDSDDGQYEFGVAISPHFGFPLGIVNLVVGVRP